MGQMIEFDRPDGGRTSGYLASAGDGAPGMILIQEWWGLKPHIKDIAERLASAGITTLAPDLYRGRIAADADEASHLMNGLDFGDATTQDLQGALNHLRDRLGCAKVGVMGYCMGGALTVAASVHVPELDAAVCYYGIPPTEFADPAKISVPFMGHFATRDDWCTPEKVSDLEQRMTTAGKHPAIHRYEADHAFSNATRPEVYDADAAQLAWQRTLDFLKQHLA
ncbi:dienelactone hydrolase family protein [Roseateles amylovorans]|uniref:Dienelactone hydrolase family protein n=1 Tax=Roseateles amylovorans TaxID=2978473 RepID=A0ABY6B138_9BURK|nr:dienelactone hydrolase family protein [Roseateles amylovorans]UXH78878.1 dienelactone hydrolase family protein [Roseateles amylovorans]